MKKFMLMMSIFLMTGLVSMEAGAQTPNSSRANTTRSRTATSVTKPSSPSTSSAAARQMRKGDAQLNKANNSYQKAQQQTSRPASSSVTRQTTLSNVRPSASTGAPKTISTEKPAAKTTTTVKPSSPATTRPANSNVSNRTTMAKPTTTTTNPTISNSRQNPGAAKSAQVSSGKVPTPNGESSSVKRGYTEQGKAQPQPVSGPRNGGNLNGGDVKPAPGNHHPESHGPHPGGAPHTPYVHPNHHNYHSYMHVPHHVRPVYYHGTPYYFYNSVFCRYINGHYVICRPPLGAVIAYAIFHTWKPVIVVHNNVSYYYDDGTFYLPYNNNYQVVAPPIGARIAELPSNYEEIILDNTLYYKVDNVYYKAVVVSGYIWYEVVFVS